MFFEWNEQTLRWLLDASEYTGYSRGLAQLLLRHISGGSLCDVGCGMGLVDFELAGHVKDITCVDISSFAVDFIRGEVQRRGIGNLTALVQDGLTLRGQWDTVMALFHGDVKEICRPYLRCARERLILVTHAEAEGSFGPQGHRVIKACNAQKTIQWLDAQHIRYTLERHELEFGQPHRSFEDALAFTRTYSRPAPDELLAEHVKQAIVETGREDFPFYTPKKRRFGIFIIGRDDNEEFS